MSESKAKKLRRLVFGIGFHWPTVKANPQLRKQYRRLKAARGPAADATIRQAIHRLNNTKRISIADSQLIMPAKGES